MLPMATAMGGRLNLMKRFLALALAAVLFSTGCATTVQEQKQTLPLKTYVVPELGFSINYPDGATTGADAQEPTVYSFHHDTFPMLAVIRTTPEFELPLTEETANSLHGLMVQRYLDAGDLIIDSSVSHISDDIWKIDIVRETVLNEQIIRVHQRLITNSNYAWELHIPFLSDKADQYTEDAMRILDSFSIVTPLAH